MTLDIINDRLKTYTIETKQAELNALKEISQEVALAGLARAGFFKHALFQGGTCLRIIHGLKRFSEDLDFILNTPNQSFKWEPYLAAIKTEFEAFGLSLSVTDRAKASDTVKKAFLKENSFGKVLNLHYERTRSDTQTINIKLEIDTNPPAGSIPETHVLDYPYPLPVITQDLPSLFAGKCHALLCRKYIKGRDWFDFTWYIQQKIQPNYTFLKNALKQYGPYQEQVLNISQEWLSNALSKKIESLNWPAVANDVKPFLP
ncbi:MAG: hypothetical protein COV52_02375, partial [Gammaproteobacteria bacterium CG11_big_fil_rev_8_21_14_0_20_46_22]